MVQLISIVITLVAILVFFKLKKNANKKYGDSITFQIIDREYNKWYKKKGNGAVINKNTASMFEVDKVIWELNKNLVKQGITKDQLNSYRDFLDRDSPKEYGFKGIVLTILSYFGIQNMLKNILSDVFSNDNILDFEGINTNLSKISSFYSSHSEVIQIVLSLVLFIFFFYLLIRVMYTIVNMDSLHKFSLYSFFIY